MKTQQWLSTFTCALFSYADSKVFHLRIATRPLWLIGHCICTVHAYATCVYVLLYYIYQYNKKYLKLSGMEYEHTASDDTWENHRPIWRINVNAKRDTQIMSTNAEKMCKNDAELKKVVRRRCFDVYLLFNMVVIEYIKRVAIS